MATVVDAPAQAAPPTPRVRHRASYAAALTGLVAIVCAVLLPFAPVLVNEPVVEWPRPDTPASTLLPLTAQRPLEIDVRFGCAASAPDGIVLATLPPRDPGAEQRGLLVTARDGRVEIRAAGRLLLAEPLPAGACTYRVTGRSAGLPAYAAVPPRPASGFDPGVPRVAPDPDPSRVARPGDAELVVERDGVELARVAAAQLPEVNALVSSASPPPTVRLRLDDEFTARPAPAKSALLSVLVAALLATGALLVVRWSPGRATPRLRPGDVAADAVVGGVLLGWLFVAPATDDDGWFGTQARDGADGIRSYFQLFDYGFTPFTWPYEALHRWQEAFGTAPAVQRVPALVAGMLTWLIVRRLVAAAVAEHGPARRWSPAVAAVAFLAWWLPYGMGVRPEALVALAGAGTLLAVVVAYRRSSAAAAWLACAVAGAGMVTHPAGLVALAPLVAGAGLLWRAVAEPGARWTGPARALAVVSGLAVAPLLGFADGALRDLVRTRTIVGAQLTLDGWAEEPQRYALLLDTIPMGNYARRGAVLACLLALLWCALLAAGRARLPLVLRLAAASTALGLLALAGTPSKWTHHFGGLAGIGPVFLASMLVLAVPLTRSVLPRPPWWLVAAVAGSAAAVLGLSWQGPNAWGYAWLAGMPSAYATLPVVSSPTAWAAATLLVAALLTASGPVAVRAGRGARALGRRARAAGWLAGLRVGPGRPPDGAAPRRADAFAARWRDPRGAAIAAVATVVTASLAGSVAHPVAMFGTAALAGRPADSLWARTTAAPTGCGVADAIRVADPVAARPLTSVGATAAAGFVPGGHLPDHGPQIAGEVWGSFTGPDPDETRGRVSTAWFALPADRTAVVVTAAGSLAGGNDLTAVYGAGGVALSTAQPLTDTARSPVWRSFVLVPPPGADSVRLDAVDASGGIDGWLAFTTPAAAPVVTLQELVPAGEPVAPGWQLAFGLPCLRPPTLADGIVEPPRFAVLRGAGPLGGLFDIGFAGPQGGPFAAVRDTGSVLRLAVVGPADPYVQVYVFDSGLARGAYTLTGTERETPGGRVR